MSWIKMRTNLLDHPKVVRMARALKLKTKRERLQIVGGLWAVWITFDEHSVDGVLEGYTMETMDDNLGGWRGFSEAMAEVKWLVCSEDGLTMPEFDEHNGQSAKRRAQDAKRKRGDRDADDGAPEDGETSPKRPRGKPPDVGQMSASEADTKRTRGREEKEKKKDSVGSAENVLADITPAAAICRALRVAGIAGVNPSNPMLIALIVAGATEEEFVDAVSKALGKRDPFGYLLTVVKGRREDAAAAAKTMPRGPLVPDVPWQDTAEGIKRKGAELGIVWRDDGWVGDEYMPFPTYKARVLRMASGDSQGRSAEGGAVQ